MISTRPGLREEGEPILSRGLMSMSSKEKGFSQLQESASRT
jgi:hypothetical protein